MLRVIALIVMVSAAAAYAQTAPAGANAPAGFIPLLTTARGLAGTPEGQPIVRVGNLSAGKLERLDFYAEMTADKRMLFPAIPPKLEYAPNGQDLQIVPARPGSEVVIYLVGPHRNTGEFFAPVSLERRGNAFMLHVSDWTDDVGRKQNLRTRTAYMLSLGKLPEGSYALTIAWETLAMKECMGRQFWGYVPTGMRVANVKWAVGDAKGPGDAERPVSVSEDQFRAAEMRKPPEPGAFWALPTYAVRAMPPGLSVREMRIPNFSVGSFDATAWLAKDPAKLTAPEDWPRLEAPDAAKGIYAAVVGPMLDHGQWMSLRRVTWRDNLAIIHVLLWQNQALRRANERFCPMVLVPLVPPGPKELAAGKYRARVTWTVLVQGESGVYAPDKEATEQMETLTGNKVDFEVK